MKIIEPLIQELQHESLSTKKLLERVPEEHFDWQPHAKSMSLRELASHLVDSLGWVGPTLEQEELSMDPSTYKPWLAESRSELVQTWDKNLAQAVAQMSDQSDESVMVTWTFKVGGQVVFSMPRIAVLRSMILNHLIHHRAQLGVYLRLKDVPLPQTYGPSADEPMAPA